jgi:hypothetical protein
MDASFYSYLQKYEGKEIEVIIRKKRSVRTQSSNRYYWGVVVKSISDYTGYDAEDTHNALKTKFLGNEDEHGLLYAPSTASMEQAEFAGYIDRIIAWAAGFGVYIPDATDVYF